MKNRNIIIIAIILLVIAIWLYLANSGSTIKKELRDFAVEDTSQVSKIFMVNKNNESVVLERKSNNIWYVNGKFPARKDAVDLILKTFKRIDIKSPVPKAQFENVVKRLAATHVKVEIYTNDSDPEKVVFVGGPTQDNYGTYMMLENSSTPFITYIPGFSGYLSSRFFIEEVLWRDQTIFRLNYDMIKSVQLDDIKKPENSFKVTNLGNNRYELFDVSGEKNIAEFDTLKAKFYLSQFKKLSFERIADEVNKERFDSIVSSDPLYRIILEDRDGKLTEIDTYLRKNPVTPGYEDDNEFDIERMYARINKDIELVIVQYYVFDPILLNLDFFRKLDDEVL